MRVGRHPTSRVGRKRVERWNAGSCGRPICFHFGCKSKRPRTGDIHFFWMASRTRGRGFQMGDSKDCDYVFLICPQAKSLKRRVPKGHHQKGHGFEKHMVFLFLDTIKEAGPSRGDIPSASGFPFEVHLNQPQKSALKHTQRVQVLHVCAFGFGSTEFVKYGYWTQTLRGITSCHMPHLEPKWHFQDSILLTSPR